MPLVILGSTATVVAALFTVLWRERSTARDARVALLTGGVLSLWAAVATVLAHRGVFQPRAGESVPPVGSTSSWCSPPLPSPWPARCPCVAC